MSDIGALEAPKQDQRLGPWTRRLVLFLRIMAGISMAKGLYHWSLVLGVGAAVGLSIAALVVALNDDDPVRPAPAHAEENSIIVPK